MSLELILKNICLFLELLQKVRSSDDLFLNAESFRNAFQWAEYCQKIYLQSIGKPYEQQLDEEIKKLNNLPWALGDLFIDLQFLGKSVSWLSLALIQNEKLMSRDNLLKPVVEKAWRNVKGFEELIAMNSSFKDILSIESENQKIDSLFDEKLEIFHGSCNNIERLKLETSSSLLVDYVHKILSSATCDDSVRRMFLKDKLNQLSKLEVGLAIILRSYLTSYSSKKKCHVKVFQYFDSFVSGMITKSDENFWSSIPKNVAVELCSVNEDVLKKLFHDLQRSGKSFEVHYNENIRDETTGRISLFQWRLNTDDTSNPNVSYDWLKCWVVTFLNDIDDDNVKERSAEIISEMAKSSDVNIWRTICQELQRVDLLIDKT